MPTICTTSYEYISGTVATTTELCLDALKISVTWELGLLFFAGSILLGIYVFIKK